jgi:hypothetical protein
MGAAGFKLVPWVRDSWRSDTRAVRVYGGFANGGNGCPDWLAQAFLTVLTMASLLASGSQALANHVQCGDVITQDTTLDSDLIGCPGDGIVIGGSDITLDLGGHTVEGNAIGVDSDSRLMTIAHNLGVRNGDLGIEAVAGVSDGGGNRAFGNGNSLQCLNVVCIRGRRDVRLSPQVVQPRASPRGTAKGTADHPPSDAQSAHQSR